jgi:hypothetical protein
VQVDLARGLEPGKRSSGNSTRQENRGFGHDEGAVGLAAGRSRVVILMAVRLAVSAVIALHGGLDQAGSTRRWQRISIVARVLEQERGNRDGVLASREPFRNRLLDHLPQHVLIHKSSL